MENPCLRWKTHTANLLKEIMINDQCVMLKIPIKVFANQLARVAQRASQLNDPQLNALMCELTLYDIADQLSPDVDLEQVRKIYQLAEVAK